jgi:hypothetical protein
MPRKVFTAGEVLAAADVNEFLGDQAVMTFAGTAARGSAIPSPVEGMVAYLEDTNLYTAYNGGWNSLGSLSGAGLVHIKTATVSGATSVSLNNVFSSAYKSYKIIIEGLRNGRGAVEIRLRSGTDASGANYGNTVVLRDSGALLSGYTLTDTAIALGNFNSDHESICVIDIANPFNAARTAFLSHTTEIGVISAANAQIYYAYSGAHHLANSYDGFTFLSGANITATIKVYGYKE